MPYYLLRAPRTAAQSSEYIHALVRSLVGPQVTNFLVHQSLGQIPDAKTLNLIPDAKTLNLIPDAKILDQIPEKKTLDQILEELNHAYDSRYNRNLIKQVKLDQIRTDRTKIKNAITIKFSAVMVNMKIDVLSN